MHRSDRSAIDQYLVDKRHLEDQQRCPALNNALPSWDETICVIFAAGAMMS